ncbi:uncharacterized protein PSFLO_06071 [Pseudozyma flocculosa]|uniref:Uncharacterized protein n=1 Tax=Pseudozyma flocculosa TaxID=84751 RepID=A0A5C3FB72_9BASI|nr:uncharacterized protein PSFLO_06071 [Pseudozyma flocculosa]
MNWDPLSREAAPPRYQVESGSEDEDDHADLTSSLEQREQHTITIELDGAAASATSAGRELVVLVAGAGKAWLTSRGAPAEGGRLRYGQDQPAELFLMPSAALPQTRLAQVAGLVLDRLAPKSLVVVDSYSPAAYGYHRSPQQNQGDRVRFLHSGDFEAQRIAADWEPLEAPDAVIGASAALVSAAALRGVPVLLVQVPDKGPQSHAQLYGSGQGARYTEAAQLEGSSLEAIDAVVGPGRSAKRVAAGAAGAGHAPSLLDFVARRRPALPRGSLGDGGMYM